MNRLRGATSPSPARQGLSLSRRARQLASMVVLSALAVTGLALAAPQASAAPAGYNVFVGYADTARPAVAHFPTPFDPVPGNGVVREGAPGTASLDGGAIRIANATAVTETVNFVTVSFGPCTFDLWPHNVSLPFGGQLVLDQTLAGTGNGCAAGTQTIPQTMDSSDFGPGGAPWAGNCSQSHVIPQVTVSVNGVATTYPDTGQVLNTGGVDAASCTTGNESTQWVSIGSPPCSTGAVLSLTPPSQTQDVGQTATVTANLSACGTPLQGAPVTFTVSSGPNAGTTGSGISDASGNAVFSYPSSITGTDTLSASVTNAAGMITSNTVTVIWTKRPTTITSTTALQLFAQTSTATLSSTLTDAHTSAPLPGKPVTMTLGSGPGAQSCTATTSATGTATCPISPVTVALGPQPITDTFAGDAADQPSSNTQHALVFAYSTGGSFVVGDRSDTGSVTFWGSQWATQNSLSGGPAPASFKGFQDSAATPTCRTSWSTDPGNSTPPPAGPLPSYLAVIVASHVTKSGSTITGDSTHVIIVQTDAGYQPDPGHPGTGTVIATLC